MMVCKLMMILMKYLKIFRTCEGKSMKHLKRFIIFITVVVLVLVITNIVPWAPTKAKNNEKWLRRDGEAPLIIPHGGAKEMYPENTMYAFDMTSHYDAFEIDLALTDDNILISHHDLDLDLMANRPDLKVRDLKYDEIIQVITEAGFPHVRGFNGTVKKKIILLGLMKRF